MLVYSKRKISKEEYERVSKLSQKEISDYIEDIANNSGYPPMGYGFYLSRMYQDTETGEYFVCWEHSDSCD